MVIYINKRNRYAYRGNVYTNKGNMKISNHIKVTGCEITTRPRRAIQKVIFKIKNPKNYLCFKNGIPADFCDKWVYDYINKDISRNKFRGSTGHIKIHGYHYSAYMNTLEFLVRIDTRKNNQRAAYNELRGL